MFFVICYALLLFTHYNIITSAQAAFDPRDDTPSWTYDVSACPGYNLKSLQNTKHGFTAYLTLAGQPCNAFSNDITNLTIQVSHETQFGLHVNIFDTANKQFTPPTAYFEPRSTPPTDSSPSFTSSSDLVFNYESTPFAFWVTRRSEPDAAPLFDTRVSSLPPTPIPAFVQPTEYNPGFSTGFDGFPLVFEEQYLQLTSALPLDANIYGLGEIDASSGFRRDLSVNGTIQTMWARDDPNSVNLNLYGSHPIYLEHRFNKKKNTSSSHGVFLSSAAGADILLATPPSSGKSLIQYRMLGGTLDFYFFSGPDPKSVIEQYGEVVGKPTWQPLWAFGFHLCRWGYENIWQVQEQVENMRANDIPLETIWNDIDVYHSLRDFTSDPVSYPGDVMREFTRNMSARGQHYIPIVDAAIPHIANDTDIYDPFSSGIEKDVFIKNPVGSLYIGQVWPGYTVFPDWFARNVEQYWTEALANWSLSGVEFSGLWLDMNEASSFCLGSCGSGADLSNTTAPFPFPGDPGNPVLDYPEGYNSTFSGPSGNITVNGTKTYGVGAPVYSPVYQSGVHKRGVGAGDETDVDLNNPQYTIHNGFLGLSNHTIATNATHAGGFVELDTHNLFGYMEERATYRALTQIRPGERPFLISRSTFPSSGAWTGHWLGDNFSKWAYLQYSIAGILQFQLYQIPMVGADTCGFVGNTNEELCNRWMQASAFVPFYRNHNTRGAIPQEPYRWDSVAEASRTAIAIRYAMLPYWYTLFANASTYGTPPVRALFFEFPNEPELFAVDLQWMIGSDILITPVTTPNVASVDGVFPGRGDVVWRDWYTHEVLGSTPGGNTTLSAPLSHINVHIRSGAAILLFSKPGYTITETAQSPYSLLVSLTSDEYAFGNAYIDDGITLPTETAPVANRTVTFSVDGGRLDVASVGNWDVAQRLDVLTVLGVLEPPTVVNVGGRRLTSGWSYETGVQRLNLTGMGVDLNLRSTTVTWS